MSATILLMVAIFTGLTVSLVCCSVLGSAQPINEEVASAIVVSNSRLVMVVMNTPQA
ncbi:hypothetical protein TUM4261_24100 [Shewanella sp. c952]|nr:hypothetical protein TUM4261_24100 [Shewanella sp. c952]